MSSYLGPKSFKITPLTSSNLAYLNSSTDMIPLKSSNNHHNNLISTSNLGISLSPIEPSPSEQDKKKLPTNTQTDSSSSAFSTISTVDTPKSSETSYNSIAESSHRTTRTLIDLNDEDNKTVIFPSNTSTNIIINIPTSPLRSYDVVSVSSSSSSSSISNQIPLLRKKSGELVKSSLKLSSLQRSNSMPNAKSVRFATRLENVKFFKKSEKPAAVSTNTTSRFSTPKMKTQWEFDSNSSNSDDDDNDESDNEQDLDLDEDDIDTQRWNIVSNDSPYNPFSLNFAKLASNNNVILESVKLNSSGNSLIGFVYAKNIAFKKKIIVKLTYDSWKSFVEIENANYISSNHIFKYSDSNSVNYDKFSFIIKLDNLNFLNNSTDLNLEFCIQYVANDISYWDNNDGNNYKVQLKKVEKSKPTLQPSFKEFNFNKKPTNYFDIEDSNIKLKSNNNFMNSSNSKPLTADMSSLKISNSFGLKKIRSESSIPSMKSNLFSEYNNKSTSSLLSSKINDSISLSSPSSTNKLLSKFQVSKSASTSPALKSTAFENNSPREFTDYDNIVKQYCFYNSPSTANNSTSCSNDQTHLDSLHHLKSQASMFVDM